MTRVLSDFDRLPAMGLIRQRELTAGIVPFSGATLWRRVKDGSFPKPLKLDGNITAWRVGDVREWLSTQGHEPQKSERRELTSPATKPPAWFLQLHRNLMHPERVEELLSDYEGDIAGSALAVIDFADASLVEAKKAIFRLCKAAAEAEAYISDEAAADDQRAAAILVTLRAALVIARGAKA